MQEVFNRISTGDLPLHSLGGLVLLLISLMIGWGCCSLFAEYRQKLFEYKKKESEGVKNIPSSGTDPMWGFLCLILFVLHLVFSHLGWSAMVGHWI